MAASETPPEGAGAAERRRDEGRMARHVCHRSDSRLTSLRSFELSSRGLSACRSFPALPCFLFSIGGGTMWPHVLSDGGAAARSRLNYPAAR